MSKVKKFFATFAGILTAFFIKIGKVSAQALYGVPEPQDLYGVPNPTNTMTNITSVASVAGKVIFVILLVITIPAIIIGGVIALVKINNKENDVNKSETNTKEKIKNEDEKKD